MGMYDTVILDIKCPHCGVVSENDPQTKELDCSMETWRKGDFVSDKFNYFEAFCDCPKCKKYFYSTIFLEHGRVSGKYKTEKRENEEEE